MNAVLAEDALSACRDKSIFCKGYVSETNTEMKRSEIEAAFMVE